MNFQTQNAGSVQVSRLRLAEAEPVSGIDPVREAARQIARENHVSRMVGPNDARWELACEVQRSVEGGRAAIIRPEVRRRLVAAGTDRGLRPFDANLVIAVVQDGARRGEKLDHGVAGRLAFLGPADDDRPRRYVSLLVGAAALGLAGFVALVAWLTER